MLHHLREIDIVHLVTIKKDAFFFLTTTVFGVDTTFNLCNLWAADTCYHNKRMVNLEKEITLCFQDLTYSISQRMTKHFQEQHVNFLTQSESRSTLKRSELTSKKTSQSLFQRLILNIKVLFSVRHLKHRDEMKLDSLMEKWKKQQLQQQKKLRPEQRS